jgi:AcrR family transcriptional regulator
LILQRWVRHRNFDLLRPQDGGTVAAMPAAKRHLRAMPQSRGEAFVREVLSVTLAHLADVGFERLSIPQIAELAAVNKTSIYRRWPNKDELVRDALQAGMQHATQAPDTGTLRGDLVELARTMATFAQSPMGTALLRIVLAEGSHPELRALANPTQVATNKQGPWVVINRAKERGELRHDVAPSLVLFTIAGAIIHRILVEQKDVSHVLINQVVDLVLLGAAAKGS